jgi:hypothetical protein
MADAPQTDGAPPRSCLGCLTASGLGCLAFLVGAGLAIGLFGASLMSGALQVRIQDQLSGRIAGSIEIGSLVASVSARQRAENVLLRDPDGRVVAIAHVELPSLTELFWDATNPAHIQIEVVEATVDWNANGESDLVRALQPVPIEEDVDRDERAIFFDIIPFDGAKLAVKSPAEDGLDLVLESFDGHIEWAYDSGAGFSFEGDLGEDRSGVSEFARLVVESSAPDVRGLRTGTASMSGIERTWLESWLGEFDYLGQVAPEAVNFVVEFEPDSSGAHLVAATVRPSDPAQWGDLHLTFDALLQQGRLVPTADHKARLKLRVPHTVLESAARSVLPGGEAWSATKDGDLSVSLFDFDLPLSWTDVMHPLVILRRGSWSMSQDADLEVVFESRGAEHPWDVIAESAILSHDGDGAPQFDATLRINKKGTTKFGAIAGQYFEGQPQMATFNGPAAFADELLGLQGYLSDMLGGSPQFFVDPPTQRGDRPIRIEDGTQKIKGLALRDDVLVLDGPSLRLDLPWNSSIAEDTVEVMLPFLDIKTPPMSGNLVLTVDALYLPLPYDLNTLTAQVSIDVEDAIPAFTGEVRKLLVLDDPEGKMPRLEIVEIDIGDGEATYEFLELEIEGLHLEWAGRLDLVRSEVDLNIVLPVLLVPQLNEGLKATSLLFWNMLKGLTPEDLEAHPAGLGTFNLRGDRNRFTLSQVIGSGDEEIRGMSEIIDAIIKGFESMTGTPSGG